MSVNTSWSIWVNTVSSKVSVRPVLLAEWDVGSDVVLGVLKIRLVGIVNFSFPSQISHWANLSINSHRGVGINAVSACLSVRSILKTEWHVGSHVVLRMLWVRFVVVVSNSFPSLVSNWSKLSKSSSILVGCSIKTVMARSFSCLS